MRDLAQEFVDAANYLTEGHKLELAADEIAIRLKGYEHALQNLVEAYGGRYEN